MDYTKLDMMKDKMYMWAELVGGWCETFGDYPAWAYKAPGRRPRRRTHRAGPGGYSAKG